MQLYKETLQETLERHYLCRVLVADNLGTTTAYKVLCVKCRNASVLGFKRISFSEKPCDECGVKWEAPPGIKAIKCKDKTVTITARYPDLETARNALS